MNKCDVVIVGGGAAGLMCALTAGRRGRSVVVLEGSNKAGKKILMSGGGRCNFTHLHSTPANFLSANPHFCKSALSRFTPHDFLAMVERHGIAYHEKTPGQLFCDHSSKDILHMLIAECETAGVRLHTHATVESVRVYEDGYHVTTASQSIETTSLVIASGGLSIPKMGASDFGYRLARQFNLPVLPTRAGLVPFTFSGALHEMTQALSGVSVHAIAQCESTRFADGLLFTHRGLSGPAALQISSYWRPGDSLTLDLAPNQNIRKLLFDARTNQPKKKASTILAGRLPKALATYIAAAHDAQRTPLAELGNRALEALADAVSRWTIRPAATEGYRTAEVTLGGVDTQALSSRTMAARDHDGLYFIGEVVDVTGHLGGHNFQWAWASGFAAGSVV